MATEELPAPELVPEPYEHPEGLPPLISEADAIKKYGRYLQDRELRVARQERVLGYYVRKNRVLYREDELIEFIKAILEKRYVPPDPNARERTFKPPEQASSVSIPGMTPELMKSACNLLRQQSMENFRNRNKRNLPPKR